MTRAKDLTGQRRYYHPIQKDYATYVPYFTKPPRVVQKVLFAILAPVARLLGYRGSYPEYLERGPTERVEVEPWTNAI